MKFMNKINFSNLQKNQWYNLTLINPEKKYRIFKIPNNYGKIEPYIQYEGFFTELGSKRVFKISLPFYQWRRIIHSMPLEVRKLNGHNIELEIMKANYGKLKIRNWRIIN